MNDISVIEWLVYGSIAYGTIIIYLISLIKDVPQTRDLALTRVFMTIPGLILNGVLATSGNIINFLTTTSTHVTKTYNATNVLITNSTTTDLITNQVVLVSPVWIMVHIMFFIICFWIIVTQVMFILKDPKTS